VGFIPAKADPEKQSSFIEKTLKPLIKQAKNGEISLFFVDASHFVMGGFPGYLWGKVRQFIMTGSGRKRFNVLGALNFATKKIETVVNDTYINAVEVMNLIDLIVSKYQNRIYLVLDNARYQRCAAVMEYAAKNGVNLIFLPTYSPNLNLIERIWKFVKAEVLSAAYYESFDEFKFAISSCIGKINTLYSSKISSLISENIQLFDDIPLRNVA